jgi:hypothetical protein
MTRVAGYARRRFEVERQRRTAGRGARRRTVRRPKGAVNRVIPYFAARGEAVATQAPSSARERTPIFR